MHLRVKILILSSILLKKERKLNPKMMINYDIILLYGCTPLIHASKNENIDIVIYLIDKGAEIQSKDNKYKYTSSNGFTPLIHASMEGHLETVKYLVGIGLDIEAKSHDSFTLYYILKWTNIFNFCF